MITVIKNSMHAYNYGITIFELIYCVIFNDFLIFPRFQTIEATFMNKIFWKYFLFVEINFTKVQ